LVGVAPRHGDEGEAPVLLPEIQDEAKAVPLRHGEVRDDRVEPADAEDSQGYPAVSGVRDLVAIILEDLAEYEARDLVVVDIEYPGHAG